MYASIFGISGVLHLDVFEQPEQHVFFSNLPESQFEISWQDAEKIRGSEGAWRRFPQDPVYLLPGCVVRYLEFETIRVKRNRT